MPGPRELSGDFLTGSGESAHASSVIATRRRLHLQGIFVGALVGPATSACGSAGDDEGSADSGSEGDTASVGGTSSAGDAPTTTAPGTSNSTVGSTDGSSTAAADESSGGDDGPQPGMDCDGLAPGKVGVWEEITPPEFATPDNMEAAAIAVNPIDCSVYAAAGNETNGGDGGTGIFKSTDAGASWSKISTGENGAKLETGVIWAMRIDPVEPERMYVASGYGADPTIYRSIDGGVDWEMLDADPDDTVSDFAQAIGMDRDDPRHIIITWHETCSAPHTPNCLSRTKDGGDTWTILDGPPSFGGWVEGASITIFGPDSYLLAADAGGWFTDDAGATWDHVIDGVHYGVYAGGAHFAPDGAAYIGMANQGVFVSRGDRGAPLGSSWTLIPGSPQAALLIDDGVTLYATYLHDFGGQPYWSAPIDDPTTWTNMPSPSIGRGAVAIDYDAAQHLVYSANGVFGLWRLRTE